tara:strand:+ start:935 stop:1426 length:492 start_codon:yes stop_codon:yes gene_type:complete
MGSETELSFKKHSGIFTLQAEQKLPISIEEAWEFFSSPKNLVKITPEHMGFKITSGEPSKMYQGQIITYQIGLLPGVKSGWVTEITHVNEPHLFVDEQRYGPYSMWHHEHSFEPTEGGVLVKDKVSYKIPFWFLGIIVEKLFIRNQLKNIFQHRNEVLNQLFN